MPSLFLAGWSSSYLFYFNGSEIPNIEFGKQDTFVPKYTEIMRISANCERAHSLVHTIQSDLVQDQEIPTKLAEASSPTLLNLEVVNEREGGLANKFAKAVGLTPFEEKNIEKLMSEYGQKLKILQVQHLVESPNSNGLRFIISSFSPQGEILNNEFITKIRGSMIDATYSRFMSYASDEISRQMGDFGKSRFEFSFESDNGESVLNVTRYNGELAAPEISRFIGMSIPPTYSHLFTFDENTN